MSAWPRHRGPILVPVAAVCGVGLVLALLINGAHARTQEAQRKLAAAASRPSPSSDFVLGPSAAESNEPLPGAALPGESTSATPTKSPSPSASSAKPTATPPEDRPTISAALAAVKAWQQPRVAIRQASLKAISTPEYLAVIADADPARIPKSPPSTAQVFNESAGLARVSVTLKDGTSILVDLTYSKKLWLVSDISSGG